MAYIKERTPAFSGEAEVIGKTLLGRDIILYHIGAGAKTLLIGGVHAREYVTCGLLERLIAREAKDGINVDYLPVLNPDGVMLCKYGIESVTDEAVRKRLIEINGGSRDFRLWKANASGVDVNVNFDADWGDGKYNVTEPAPANYIGKYACSEPETIAVTELLKKNDYALVVCYHSLGEEVYWGYESNFRHYKEAKRYADYLGYALKRSENSTGGIKDYYALNFGGLGLTVEIGKDSYGHPCGEEKCEEIYLRHRGSLALLDAFGEEIYGRIHVGGAT